MLAADVLWHSEAASMGDAMRIVIPEDRPRYELPVRDGSILTLSPILKTDREFFEQGIQELSLESRFSRFGRGVGSLSASELDYLSDVNQTSHVAWGAAFGEEAAGVGRYVASGDGSAEFAITVLDHMQRRGVGTALLAALVAVARADGLQEMWFEAQAENPAIRRMIGELEVRPLISDGVIERRIRLSDLPTSEHEAALVGVIAEVRHRRRA